MRRFDMLRACFYLVGAILLLVMLETLIGATTCIWLVALGRESVGACSSLTQQLREIWAEMLAAVMALLVASRPPPSDPPSRSSGENPDGKKEI